MTIILLKTDMLIDLETSLHSISFVYLKIAFVSFEITLIVTKSIIKAYYNRETFRFGN